jgi:hypothetical protein
MKNNLYAISTEDFIINGTQYLTSGKEYKVWKILNRSDMRIVVIDDMGHLTDWGARLFIFKEV